MRQITCVCCGSSLTMPQFHNGKPYGYTCIKKVNPSHKLNPLVRVEMQIIDRFVQDGRQWVSVSFSDDCQPFHEMAYRVEYDCKSIDNDTVMISIDIEKQSILHRKDLYIKVLHHLGIDRNQSKANITKQLFKSINS